MDSRPPGKAARWRRGTGLLRCVHYHAAALALQRCSQRSCITCCRPIVGYFQEVTASEAHRLQLNMPRSMLPAGPPACQGDHHATLRCHAMGLRGQVCSSMLCVWHRKCRCVNPVELHHKCSARQCARTGAARRQHVWCWPHSPTVGRSWRAALLRCSGAAVLLLPYQESCQMKGMRSTRFKHPLPHLATPAGRAWPVSEGPKGPFLLSLVRPISLGTMGSIGDLPLELWEMVGERLFAQADQLNCIVTCAWDVASLAQTSK